MLSVELFITSNSTMEFINYQPTRLSPPDRPETPVLTPNVKFPKDGDAVVLTCSSSTPGVSKYKFLKDGVPLFTAASNTYTINSAELGQSEHHVGVYTCVVYIDTVASQQSKPHVVTCRCCLH